MSCFTPNSRCATNRLEDIAEAAAAANRIQAMRVPDRPEGPGAALNFSTVDDADGGVRVELQDVGFKYPTRNVHVLNGLNITVSAESPPHLQ